MEVRQVDEAKLAVDAADGQLEPPEPNPARLEPPPAEPGGRNGPENGSGASLRKGHRAGNRPSDNNKTPDGRETCAAPRDSPLPGTVPVEGLSLKGTVPLAWP